MVEAACLIMLDKWIPVSNIYESVGLMYNLRREDIIYFDKSFLYISTKKHPGFNSFSEVFRERMPGFALDKNQRVVSLNPQQISYSTLINVLKSKDKSLLETFSWLFNSNSIFLDNSEPIDSNKVAILSFMRSGNTLARRMIEKVTGISTGATTSLNISTPL